MAEAQFISTPSEEEAYHLLDNHPWDTDEEFKEGLQSILESNSHTPEATEDLITNVKCFYFCRQDPPSVARTFSNAKLNVEIDTQAYKAWSQRQAAVPKAHENGVNVPVVESSQHAAVQPLEDTASTSREDAQEAPYPTSFSRIVELITSGEPIPGIKEIPDTILEGQESEASKPTRRKPWEKVVADETSSTEVGNVAS
ncbi:hypothetical protein MMC25_000881 [Agyrium rufum]|nr:hypothetical protein [Agyrium rufum]